MELHNLSSSRLRLDYILGNLELKIRSSETKMRTKGFELEVNGMPSTSPTAAALNPISFSLEIEIEIEIEIEMEVELPDELILQILSFLPAKSLLRFRLVCRSWLNLINSPKFKLMHLRNFNQLNPRYFVRRIDYDEGEELYNVRYDDEAFGLDIGTDIEFPFDNIRVHLCFRIVGCCNGVVCLSDDDASLEGEFYLNGIILWNPSIRRKLTLPMSYSYGLRYPSAPFVVLGFGYDKMSDDFKVVCLAYDECYPTRSRPKVEVYTVKTGIWRKVVFPGDLRCFNIQPAWSQIFSNGCVHWICTFDSNWSRYSILTFDVTTELFGEIQLPDFLEQTHFLKISAVGESLAVIHSSPINFDGLRSTESTYVVMVMKEYKNPTSWTTLYHTHYPDLDLGQPLRVRNNGYMVVQFKNRDIIIDQSGLFLRCGFASICSKPMSLFFWEILAMGRPLRLRNNGDMITFQMRSRWKQMRRAMEALMMIEKQAHSKHKFFILFKTRLHDSLSIRHYPQYSSANMGVIPIWGKTNLTSKLNADAALYQSLSVEIEIEIEIEIEMVLPDEVIVEILSMLPAKSLLRCRLVCKSWLNLMNSTKFKVMHLHNFNQLNPRYFVGRLDYLGRKEWFCMMMLLLWIAVPKLNVSTTSSGVVCLSDDDDDTIILWNPSIRRKLTLPLPMSYSVGFETPYVVGYKVVCLTYDASYSSTRPKVEVYTLKTGLWREVMFPDNLRCYHTNFTWSPMFSNGCVHWIASDPTPGVSHYSIITFDITTELFGEILLPEVLAQKHFLKVSVVGESLAVIHSSHLKLNGFRLEGSTYMVMIMKEYNNPGSWTRLYHIHNEDLDLGEPLRLQNNGDMIVELENRDIIMFNHSEGSYVYVPRDDREKGYLDCRTYVDRYQESLALLDVGDGVPNKEALIRTRAKQCCMEGIKGTFTSLITSQSLAFQSESVSLWHPRLGDSIMKTKTHLVVHFPFTFHFSFSIFSNIATAAVMVVTTAAVVAVASTATVVVAVASAAVAVASATMAVVAGDGSGCGRHEAVVAEAVGGW
ncbi:hypothetical protein OSB04_013268 [Centaurea solstitialis]|uniref:F-box domain-containing protein n=1 Tax=Centaurea solstitialis TaxID=347529 RepID=A0AA38TEP5_9ASTR|nr:hypothetical protein OSB04_013268 [Centaurea solstitialis]